MAGVVNKKDDELNRITVEAGDHDAIPTATNAKVALIIANELNAPGTSAQAVESTSQNHGEPSRVVQGLESHGDKVFKCCPDGFCEMVGRHKARNVQLSERESELRQRLATLECWIPAVTLIKMLTGEVDSSNIYNLIDEQAMTMSASNVHLHTSLSQHKDSRIRDIEAERKEAHRRLEEARKLLREKQSAVDERAKQIEEAQRKQMSLEQKIGQLQEQFERDGIDLMKVTSNESIASFGSDDLACIIKLEELVAAEEHTKRQLEELERREETYMKTLQAAGHIVPRDKKHPGVDELRGQLEVKSAANQQMADRICLLEDQVENLKGKLARCKDHVGQPATSDSKQIPITKHGGAGVRQNGKKMVDKAITATTTTVSSAAGSDHDIVERNDRGVIATVRTDSKETLTRVESAERSVQGPTNNDSNRSVGRTSRTSTYDPSLLPSIAEASLPTSIGQLAPVVQGRLSPLYEDISTSSVDTDSSAESQRQHQRSQYRSDRIESTGAPMASEDTGRNVETAPENNEGDLQPRQDGTGSVRFAPVNAAVQILPGGNRALQYGEDETFRSLRSQNDESSGWGTFMNAATPAQAPQHRTAASPARQDPMERIELTRMQLEMWLANVRDIRRQISRCPACQAKQRSLVQMCRELCHHLRLPPNLCIDEGAIDDAAAPVAPGEGRVLEVDRLSQGRDGINRLYETQIESGHFARDHSMGGRVSEHEDSAQELSIGVPDGMSTRIEDDDPRVQQFREVSQIDYGAGSTLPDIDNAGQPSRRGQHSQPDAEPSIHEVSRINYDPSSTASHNDNSGQPGRRHRTQRDDSEMPLRDVSRIKYDASSTASHTDNSGQPGRRHRTQRDDNESPLREVSRIKYDASSTLPDIDEAGPAARRIQRTQRDDASPEFREVSRIRYDTDSTLTDVNNSGRSVGRGQEPQPDDDAPPFREVSQFKDETESFCDINDVSQSPRRAQQLIDQFSSQQNIDRSIPHPPVPHGQSQGQVQAQAVSQRQGLRIVEDINLQGPQRQHHAAGRVGLGRQVGVAAMELAIWRESISDIRRYISRCPICRAKRRALVTMCKAICEHLQVPSEQCDDDTEYADVRIAVVPRRRQDSMAQGATGYAERSPPRRVDRGHRGSPRREDIHSAHHSNAVADQDFQVNDSTYYEDPPVMDPIVGVPYGASTPRRRPPTRQPPRAGVPRELFDSDRSLESSRQTHSQVTDSAGYEAPPAMHSIPDVPHGTSTPKRRPQAIQSARTIIPRRLFDPDNTSESNRHRHSQVNDFRGYEDPPAVDPILGIPYAASTPRRRPPAGQLPRAGIPRELFDSSRHTHSQVNDSTGYEDPPAMDPIVGVPYAASTPRRRPPAGQLPRAGIPRELFDSSGHTHSQVTDSTGYENPPVMDSVVGAPYGASTPRRRPPPRHSSRMGTPRELFDSGIVSESSGGSHSTHHSRVTSGQDTQVTDSTYYGEPPVMGPIVDAPFGASTPTRRQSRGHSPRMRSVRPMHTSRDGDFSSSHDRELDYSGTHSREMSDYGSRLTDSTNYGEPPNMDPITGSPYGNSTLIHKQRTGQSPHTRTVDTSVETSRSRGEQSSRRSGSPNNQHYETQQSTEYGQLPGMDSTYYQEPPQMDPITGSPVGESTPKRRKKMAQSYQTQSSRDSTMEDEDTQFLDETPNTTYGKGERQQFGLEEMRGEFSTGKDYTGTSDGPITRRKIDKGKSFNESNDRKIPVLDGLSDSQDQVFHEEPSLPYVSSDSESHRDSRSEDDEKRERRKMEKRKYVSRPISREKSKKKTGKVKKEGREHHKRSRKKEIISDTERSSVSGPSSPHVQSIRERSCCICPFSQIPRSEHEQSTATGNNCRPCPTEHRSNKTKRDDAKDGKLITMSSMKTQTAARHRDVNSNHSPDFDCEVCDCEPCGTPSTYHSSPGKARVNVATNVSPRATKRNRSISAKKTRTNG